jgi:hypothetical protein
MKTIQLKTHLKNTLCIDFMIRLYALSIGNVTLAWRSIMNAPTEDSTGHFV